MTPVDQLYTDVGPDAPVLGDCWRACIASVLDLPRDEVPHFIEQARHEGDWVQNTLSFLRGYGLVGEFFDGPPPAYEGYAIATGKSPRGDWLHAVVVKLSPAEDDLVQVWLAHDPHPSRTFLAEPATEYFVIREGGRS